MTRKNNASPSSNRRDYFDLSSWSSPEDLIGILVLVVAFVFIAVELVRSGGWRGCALSAAWCVVVVTDENAAGSQGANLTTKEEQMTTQGLPQGTSTSRSAIMIATTLALLLRLRSLFKTRIRVAMLQKMRRMMNTRIKFAIGTLFLSNIAMVSCAFIPMSCNCLVDGKEWIYISWKDHVHDSSLWTIYISAIISGFATGYHRRQSNYKGGRKCTLLYLTIIFTLIQSVGIYRCPTSSDSERIILLTLEVIAIALTQFLHYGTINRLLTESSLLTNRRSYYDYSDILDSDLLDDNVDDALSLLEDIDP